MARAKKDGRHINYYINRGLFERVEQYANEKGQTMTTAVERLLAKALDAEEAENEKP